jgi:hypothetical protein
MKIACLVFATSLLGACASESKVVRVYDGLVVEGEVVPPEAYAAYLKGVLAEEAGDLRTALAAYDLAAREDDEDPEPEARLGDVRCRLDPKDRGADDAFARALKLDVAYAPALAAEARCAGLRGEAPRGVALLDAIPPADRAGVTLEALFVRLAAQRSTSPSDARARERATALTVASAEHPAAWDALIAWARAKADDELLARGLEGLARAAPLRSDDVERGALELLGLGQAALARRVASRVADTPVEHGIHGVHDATVARLAVDDAILEGNSALAERRATRGHVPLSEVSARALILERPDIASSTARAVASADPRNGCAMMVLAALAARNGDRASSSSPGSGHVGVEAPSDRPAAACALVFAERLAVLGGASSARAWMARVGALPIAPHDPVAGPVLVDLAARGVVVEATLPLEARLELVARRREAPPPVDPATLGANGWRGDALDAKHALLWHTLVDPTGAPATTLLARMHGATDRDPIVGFALARAALSGANASGPSKSEGVWTVVRRAIAAAPAHPLLLAVAVEIAKRGGPVGDVPQARVRLMAVARTPAERALATE